MEEEIRFSSEDHSIEGLLEKSSETRGVVITHPHPLYGGNMHNNVVMSIARVYRRMGVATLRFNFRGVGASRGSYGDGVGEQEDVRSAIAYLGELGIDRIDLAGYSFGAWVNAHLNCRHEGIANMVMVSPPVAFIGFESVNGIDCLKLIVTGSRDDIAPSDLIKQLYPQWNLEAHFEVISGADHFYGGYTSELEKVLASNLQPL
ncbi:MAG: alpha/beta hydrolase [Desulfobacterales bacterium]|nr:MAG: alpha/beta hydrolase [Desulfobacterales bacterium]